MAVSIILLVLSCCLIHRQDSGSDDTSLDIPGVLQLTWILSRSTNILPQFAGIKNPDMKKLREAGQFEVILGELDDESSQDIDIERVG